MVPPRIRRSSRAVALALVLPLLALAACGDDEGDGSSRGDRSPGAPADAAATQVGPAESACTLPVLVRVPEKWHVEALTPEMVARADDESLTSPGGFALVCSILGSPAGVVAPIFVFVAPPRVAGDLTAEQLLRRFVRAAYDEVPIEVRDVTVGAGPGVEATFATSRARPSPVRLRAFALPTTGGAVVLTNGGLDQDAVDEGIPGYESVRDSIELPD